jgi:hypothetical protein
MLIYPTDDMESLVELMVVYMGRDVCGGRWADLVVRGFVLNVRICNRTEARARSARPSHRIEPHPPCRVTSLLSQS